MAEIKLEIDSKRVRAALSKAGDRAQKSIAKAILDSVNRVRNDVQVSFRAPKTGRMYPRPTGKGLYRASARGEAPAIATGNLRKRTTTILPTVQNLTGVVRAKTDYARRLEEKMNRPFLRPAVEKNRPFWERRMDEALREAEKGFYE